MPARAWRQSRYLANLSKIFPGPSLRQDSARPRSRTYGFLWTISAWPTWWATAGFAPTPGSKEDTPARSTGSGLLSVEPRQNRFGNEFLLNQIGWAVQKPLQQDEFDIGFMMRYFAGADAALGAPKGGIG